jgi:hypothetical protein
MFVLYEGAILVSMLLLRKRSAAEPEMEPVGGR